MPAMRATKGERPVTHRRIHISVRAERSGGVCRKVEAYQLRFLVSYQLSLRNL